jgi:hypothetical protein
LNTDISNHHTAAVCITEPETAANKSHVVIKGNASIKARTAAQKFQEKAVLGQFPVESMSAETTLGHFSSQN